MEGASADTAILAFEDVLDLREVVKRVEDTLGSVWDALPQSKHVPGAYGLVLGR